MKLPFKCLLLVLAASFFHPSHVSAEQTTEVQQLRIYEIFESNKQAFHARFRDDAIRIMKSYGFRFVAIWESRSTSGTEFAYILIWPSEAIMEEKWKQFMADKEWIEIKRVTGMRHGRMVGQIQNRILRKTDYSPDPTDAKQMAQLAPAESAR